MGCVWDDAYHTTCPVGLPRMRPLAASTTILAGSISRIERQRQQGKQDETRNYTSYLPACVPRPHCGLLRLEFLIELGRWRGYQRLDSAEPLTGLAAASGSRLNDSRVLDCNGSAKWTGSSIASISATYCAKPVRMTDDPVQVVWERELNLAKNTKL